MLKFLFFLLTFVRSTIFNILFYGLTLFVCIVLMPFLLTPRQYKMYIVTAFVHGVYFLEKYILGLDYEIRGAENIPSDQPFIVAAKHQSAYETMKLNILFDDPAIILKKELLNVPFWGRYLAIVDPIAIDRKDGKSAMAQVIDGAKIVQASGRPIVIFPQGTRVKIWHTAEDKPYKIGVARMHKATDMPIVPLALNTGVFWPKMSWLKWPGKVIFEFLPPIMMNSNASEVIEAHLPTDMHVRIFRMMRNGESILEIGRITSLNQSGLWTHVRKIREIGKIILADGPACILDYRTISRIRRGIDNEHRND